MSAENRPSLRERYLAEQQAQLAEDARLPDPAHAYRALLLELYDDARRESLESPGQAA